MIKDIIFPQFRKYSNNNNFFKITSFDEFEEIVIIGKKYAVYRKKAEIYPDKKFVSDLLNNECMFYENMNEMEYIKVLNKCIDDLNKLE